MQTSPTSWPSKDPFTANGGWAGLMESSGLRTLPQRHFRMIRHFGFLANRVCAQYLPKLYFAQMAKAFSTLTRSAGALHIQYLSLRAQQGAQLSIPCSGPRGV